MTEQNSNFDFDKELAKLPPHLQHRVLASRGRPTKYDDTWPDKIRLLLCTGQTVAQFAAYVGVCTDTVYEHIKIHPDFSVAYKSARAMKQAYYDDKRKRVIDGDESISQSEFLMFESTYKRCFAAAEHGYQLPELSKQKTPTDRIEYILKAVEEQNITIEAANMLINSIKAASELTKLDELEIRLNKLVDKGDA